MRKVLGLIGGALLALCIPAAAAASNGFSTGNVNMRSGPGTAYTVITTIHAGAPVTINSCGSGWCDVICYGSRGWVSANYVTWGARPVYVQPAPVYVPAPYYVRPAPSVSFSFGTTYYDDDRRRYYRPRDRWDRYDRRDRWDRERPRRRNRD